MSKFIFLKTPVDATLEARNLQSSFTEWILVQCHCVRRLWEHRSYSSAQET